MPPAPDLDLLDSLSRDELIEKAREFGAKRPEVMTRVELRDEIVRLSEPDVMAQKKQRGWLGVARDLVASVVESGLNMRDAAAKIRGEQRADELVGPPPVATVTLAEIYIAQGHPDRAMAIVEEVLEREPDHGAALGLRERLRVREGLPNRRKSRVPEAEPDTNPPPAEGPESLSESEGVAETLAAPVRENEYEHEHEHPESIPVPISASATVTVPVPESVPVPEPACVLVHEGAGWTARWQGAGEDGLVLRIVAFVAQKPEPEQITRDVRLSGLEGSVQVVELPAQAIVRAAVGRLQGEAFRPLVVAVVIDQAEGARRALYRPPGQGVTALERSAISSATRN